MKLLLILFVLAVFEFFIWNLIKMGELDSLEKELSKREAWLDERANRLAIWESELIKWEKHEKGK